MTSPKIETASSNARSPMGANNLPVGPISKATKASGLIASRAAFAISTAFLVILCVSFPNLIRFNPNVFVLMMVEPAFKYASIYDWTSSGWIKFHVSGSSPLASPISCSIVPVAPSQKSHSFPKRSKNVFIMYSS